MPKAGRRREAFWPAWRFRKSLGLPSPFFPGILLVRKPSKTQGNSAGFGKERGLKRMGNQPLEEWGDPKNWLVSFVSLSKKGLVYPFGCSFQGGGRIPSKRSTSACLGASLPRDPQNWLGFILVPLGRQKGPILLIRTPQTRNSAAHVQPESHRVR